MWWFVVDFPPVAFFHQKVKNKKRRKTNKQKTMSQKPSSDFLLLRLYFKNCDSQTGSDLKNCNDSEDYVKGKLGHSENLWDVNGTSWCCGSRCGQMFFSWLVCRVFLPLCSWSLKLWRLFFLFASFSFLLSEPGSLNLISSSAAHWYWTDHRSISQVPRILINPNYFSYLELIRVLLI